MPTKNLTPIDDATYLAVRELVREKGVAVIADIADATGLTQSTAHRSVKRLVRDGHLQKLGQRAGWVAAGNRPGIMEA